MSKNGSCPKCGSWLRLATELNGRNWEAQPYCLTCGWRRTGTIAETLGERGAEAKEVIAKRMATQAVNRAARWPRRWRA